MTNSPSTVNNFFDQERQRQAAALAGPNTDPVAVIHAADGVISHTILRKLRDDKAVGVAELWIGDRWYGTYCGHSYAIWNQSLQALAPSVADSLTGMVERTDDPALKHRQAVDYARENLPEEVYKLLDLPSG